MFLLHYLNLLKEQIIKIIMRSLFVDDINGAKSSHRHFDKMIYR